MSESLKCTYCKKSLGNEYTFSYGVLGIPRVFGCSRWVCKTFKRFKIRSKVKKWLRPYVERIYKIVQE